MAIENLTILTDEQLCKIAQEGSSTAEEMLIEKYKGLVKKKAQAYFIAGAEAEDVVQEGMIGLFKAIRNYDFERDAGFKTFAGVCINNQILTAIKNADRAKHYPLNDSVSLSKEIEYKSDVLTLGDILMASINEEPEHKVIFEETVNFLKSPESELFSKFEWEVLDLKLKGHNYREIATRLNKEPKNIDNAIQRIRKKILKYLED